MKGIAHFATGVAVATCFPEVVFHAQQSWSSAGQALSFVPLLGGLAGLLPDTLDFRFGRFVQRLDAEVDPAKLTTEKGQADPQAMAGRIAEAMDEAWETGREVRVQLHTVRVGADLWRRYRVAFDAAHGQVWVRMGPVVTTGQVPLTGHEAGGESLQAVEGWSEVRARIRASDEVETTVDIFSGPTFTFRREGEELEVRFLPWHRAWSHSLVVAALLGLLGCLLAPAAGLVMALAALAHVVEDQVGHMGSNLLFPITRRRARGLGWIHSGDAIPNLLVVWLSLAVIFLNLDRFSGAPSLPVLPYVVGVMLVPGLLMISAGIWRNRGYSQARRPSSGAYAAAEVLLEMEDTKPRPQVAGLERGADE